MSDTTRIVLIALGVTVLALVLLPLLFMGTMMGGMMGGQCCGGTPWLATGLTLAVLGAGGALLVLGLRRR